MPDDGGEGDDGTVRLWLVDRSYDDKGLVQLVYATPDGESFRRFEWAAASLGRREVTAAVDVDPEELAPVDSAERGRYREEARRMADRHDPDDEL
ncbi:hypothetical protein BRD00_04205 [Halobacteriales archaeon QS_8_69_26]|nr:MAG: hypothetical protein BRD00_04205 [Halobacteriales archaeon QS_8_69_26]